MKPNRMTMPSATLSASVVVGASLAGGALAIVTHLNTASEAFSSRAELAAPWPTLLVQAAAGLAIARWRDWRGIIGAGLFGLTGLLGLASLSDDETLKNGLPVWADAAQITIITLSAAAVVPCIAHIRQIRRTRRALNQQLIPMAASPAPDTRPVG